MYNTLKCGIVLQHLSSAQESFTALLEADKLNKVIGNQYDISIYYENVSKPCIDVDVPLMTINELWSTSGYLISTNLKMAERILSLTTNTKKILYLWDIEWIRRYNQLDYIHNVELLNNPNLYIIARSNEHAKLIEEYCNRPVFGIISNMNLQGIFQLFK